MQKGEKTELWLQPPQFLTPPDIDTAAKMQQFCMQEMKKDGMNAFFAWLATRSIPGLKRWKK